MKEKNISIVAVLFAILSAMAIGQADTTLVSSSIPTIIALLKYILALYVGLYLVINHIDFSGTVRYRIMAYTIVILLNIIHPYDNFNKMAIISSIPMFVFCLLSDRVFIRSFYIFRKFLIVISFISIVIYLDFLIGLGIPHSTVPYYGSQGVYVNYLLSYLLLDEYGLRSCGFFNEPGYFGTILALVLIASRLDYKKKGNIVMFIAGILTLSMAFFALIFMAGFFFMLKNWKTRVLSLALLATFFYVVNNVQFSSPEVNHVIERFQYDEDTGGFKGDNRKTEAFNQVFEQFDRSQNTLFGYGTGYYASLEMQGVAVYKTQILDWGYIGFIITYGLLVFCSFYTARKSRDALVFVTCFTVSIYQRPNIFTFVYILVLFGGVLSLINEMSRNNLIAVRNKVNKTFE